MTAKLMDRHEAKLRAKQEGSSTGQSSADELAEDAEVDGRDSTR